MRLDHYMDWYESQPIWVKVVLYPVLVLVMIAHATVLLPIVIMLILVWTPYDLIMIKIENRRRRKWMLDQGLVVRWEDARPRIESGSATLLLEVTGYVENGWVIEKPRNEVDPNHFLPSLAEHEQREWLESESSDKPNPQIADWALNHLGTLEPSARALLGCSPRQLFKEARPVPQDSVLVISGWTQGCLWMRLAERWRRHYNPERSDTC